LLGDAVHSFGEWQERVAAMGRSLKHCYGDASDSTRIILSAQVALLDESRCVSFGSHPSVDCVQGDHVGLAITLVHLRE
jgi:hypothetical protein